MHLFQLGVDITPNHYTLDYPVAMPAVFDSTPLGPQPDYFKIKGFAFKDNIHFCKLDTNDDCQAWNFRTGQWTQDNGRPVNVTQYFAVTEINGKLWVTGGEMEDLSSTSLTNFLDKDGNWTSGPSLPQDNQ